MSASHSPLVLPTHIADAYGGAQAWRVRSLGSLLRTACFVCHAVHRHPLTRSSVHAWEVVQPMKRSRLDIFGFCRWPSFPGLSGRVTPPPAAPLCCAPPLLSSPSSSSSSWLRTRVRRCDCFS